MSSTLAVCAARGTHSFAPLGPRFAATTRGGRPVVTASHTTANHNNSNDKHRRKVVASLRASKLSPVPTHFPSAAAATADSDSAAPPDMSARTVFALDFDGVVCDSEPESSISGWKHGVQLWPDVFPAPSSAASDADMARVLHGLKVVRPVIETGFENTLLARALFERLPGYAAEDIVADWGGLLPGLMARWKLDRADMVRGYGKIRDDWMAADMQGWLEPNLIYPGVAEACIAAEESPACAVFIVTTKQARFASAIMEQKGNLHIPPERVFSQTVSGLPKTEVLTDLAAAAAPSARLVFVEDKMSTLEKVCAAEGLETWELFLVDWGYNTAAERARAVDNPRINLISVDDFVTMLRDAAVAA